MTTSLPPNPAPCLFGDHTALPTLSTSTKSKVAPPAPPTATKKSKKEGEYIGVLYRLGFMDAYGAVEYFKTRGFCYSSWQDAFTVRDLIDSAFCERNIELTPKVYAARYRKGGKEKTRSPSDFQEEVNQILEKAINGKPLCEEIRENLAKLNELNGTPDSESESDSEIEPTEV